MGLEPTRPEDHRLTLPAEVSVGKLNWRVYQFRHTPKTDHSTRQLVVSHFPLKARNPAVYSIHILFPRADRLQMTLVACKMDRRLRTKRIIDIATRDDHNDETLWWYSVNSQVYNRRPECRNGERVRPGNARQGNGGRLLCQYCVGLIESNYF